MAYIPSIKNLALEDYIAVKEKAYDFFVKNNSVTNNMKYTTEYVKNEIINSYITAPYHDYCVGRYASRLLPRLY